MAKAGRCFVGASEASLYDRSDQSSMEIGDPLGDRFWLSPKKGKRL